MVTGRQGQPASNHPKKVRHERDQAKLLSSNDTSGYTFRGRFIDADQAASISLEASQKFHNALRWLIDRQAYRDGDQVFVAWSPTGAPVPNPTDGTGELFADDLDDTEIDVAETFAIRLRKKIWGYQAELDDRADVVVLGLDSATPGRIAVTYHRTLVGSEFLDRLEQWHSRYAWHQFLVVNEQYRRFVGVPAPNEIARAAYGRRLDDKLKRSTVERLIPCIVEARTVPQDIVRSVVRRASAGPTGFGDSANHRQAIAEWRRTLGIACGLFSGANLERDYDMTLETDRTSRDYLYGRLLATADSIESFALYKANENRITAAERLIQRFADHPFTTWRTIELSLRPYMARLQTGYPAFLNSRMRLMQDIKDAFDPNEFADPRPLSGEFLLGYDVQRRAFRQQGDSTPESSDEDASEQLDDEGID
jgi:CRISPR-associated protein Csd1